MTDPVFWPHTTTLTRKTRGDLRTAIGTLIGRSAANFTSDESTRANDSINDAQEEWKLEFPGVRGFGERSGSLTWIPDDTRIEMPEDFEMFIPGGQAQISDENGENGEPLHIYEPDVYDRTVRSGVSPYDNSSLFVGFLHGISTNGKRMLSLQEPPTTAVQITFKYVSRLEKLTLDGDELEAPPQMHRGVEATASGMFLLPVDKSKSDRMFGEAQRIMQKFRRPSANERKRPGRFLHFSELEVGGYKGSEYPLMGETRRSRHGSSHLG